MMRWIVGSSLKFRYLVIGLAVAMMLFGSGLIRSMPVDVFPEFALPQVEIQTACLGLSATDVESLVTIPMEQALAGTPSMDIMRSRSVPQLSSIVMLFRPGTDLMTARQMVSERMQTVIPTLPTWAAPPIMLQPLSSTSRIMKIGISSNSISQMDLSMIAYWSIRARLLRVPGVANVAIWGEQLKQMQVQVHPDLLKANNLSLDQVMQATADSLDVGLLKYADGAVIGTGGFIDTPTQRFSIDHVLPIISVGDMSQVVVADPNGKPLRLGDVATVTYNSQPAIGDAVINGGPGLMLVVERLPWGNTLEITRQVEAALNEMRPGLPGVTIDSTIFRPASFIEMAFENLTRALVLGCLLVVIVLIAFLFEWRTALISVIAIPLSLLAAALVLYFRGAAINTMSLAGFVIAVGVVVDDAIIDIENIVRRLRQARQEGSTRSTMAIVLDGSLEVRSAIVYATLIDAATLIPIFFLGGLSGAFFRPLAISYALAVLASMVVALTVTPALALLLLRNARVERRESPIVPPLKRAYGALLQRIVRRPQVAFGTVAAVVLVGALVAPHLGQSMFPEFKERDFLMHWVTEPSTSYPEETRIVTLASQELRSIPGVRNFGSHIGQAFLGEEVAGINFGENWISIDPSADYDKTREAIQNVVASYPGLFKDVQTYLNERIEETLSGSGEAIVVRIYGPDQNVLRAKADEIHQAMSAIPGIVDNNVELQVNVPRIQVSVDLAAAQKYGLTPGDVRREAAVIVSGEEVGDIFRDGKGYDVMVWSVPDARHSLTDIQGLQLDTPTGGHVRLDQVAKVEIAPEPNAIVHEDLSRRLDVTANVRGRDLGAVAGDVERAVHGVSMPLGYHAEILGEWAERQTAQRQMFSFAGLAAIAVFVLLYTSFGNFGLAALIFLTLPSALVGGVLAAYAGDRVISLGSLVGFFTILGIAARNGIMLISHYQHLEREEGEPFGPGLIVRGAQERLAPILMTALATGLALIPLVIAGSIPGHEIEHPMAVVILGGLATSTLLNLFIVPALYLKFGRRRGVPSVDLAAAPAG